MARSPTASRTSRSTIDAFCFGLLREFLLEAGVEPGFDIADETEAAGSRAKRPISRSGPRAGSSQTMTLRLVRAHQAASAQPRGGEQLIAATSLPAVASFVKRRAAPSATGAAEIHRRCAASSSGRRTGALLDCGPMDAPEFRWLHADLQAIGA
jgi:hypothetical protein